MTGQEYQAIAQAFKDGQKLWLTQLSNTPNKRRDIENGAALLRAILGQLTGQLAKLDPELNRIMFHNRCVLR